MLGVEKSLRRWPFKKIFTIAWRKIYPNSQISSIPALNVKKMHRKDRYFKKISNYIEYVVWGGERYDSLKCMTGSLSMSEVREKRESWMQTYSGLFVLQSLGRGDSLDSLATTAEMKEIQKQLQNAEASTIAIATLRAI